MKRRPTTNSSSDVRLVKGSGNVFVDLGFVGVKAEGSLDSGPQRITVHDEPTAVVLSDADCWRLRKRPKRFVDFLRSSPLNGVDLDLS
jgi:hypothetical protein